MAGNGTDDDFHNYTSILRQSDLGKQAGEAKIRSCYVKKTWKK